MRVFIRSTKQKIIHIALGATVAIFGFGFFAYTQSTTPEVLAQQQGAKLITLHDRGVTTTFMTDKDTIGAALEAAQVNLDDKDAVEPSRDEKLVAADYQVNVYRARPVTVVDGSLKQKVFTPYQSAERIVRDLGISLHPEDLTKVTRSEDILSQGSGLQLQITRATPFEFTLYGKTDTARTQAKTVAAMLKDKGITLGPDDRTSPALDTPITEDMQVRVWREGKQTITVDEAVAFETEQVKDADRKMGYKEVQTPGEAGERSVTYEVVIQDGKEVSRTEIASVTKKEPKKQVEIVGSKPEYMPYSGGGNKDSWLAASNVPRDMWGYAEWLVGKESGWNPNARNRSSGACGLAQALPCSKVPGDPLNPVNSLNWMNGYVNGRYGGWEGAVNHSRAKGWY